MCIDIIKALFCKEEESNVYSASTVVSETYMSAPLQSLSTGY